MAGGADARSAEWETVGGYTENHSAVQEADRSAQLDDELNWHGGAAADGRAGQAGVGSLEGDGDVTIRAGTADAGKEGQRNASAAARAAGEGGRMHDEVAAAELEILAIEAQIRRAGDDFARRRGRDETHAAAGVATAGADRVQGVGARPPTGHPAAAKSDGILYSGSSGAGGAARWAAAGGAGVKAAILSEGSGMSRAGMQGEMRGFCVQDVQGESPGDRAEPGSERHAVLRETEGRSVFLQDKSGDSDGQGAYELDDDAGSVYSERGYRGASGGDGAGSRNGKDEGWQVRYRAGTSDDVDEAGGGGEEGGWRHRGAERAAGEGSAGRAGSAEQQAAVRAKIAESAAADRSRETESMGAAMNKGREEWDDEEGGGDLPWDSRGDDSEQCDAGEPARGPPCGDVDGRLWRQRMTGMSGVDRERAGGVGWKASLVVNRGGTPGSGDRLRGLEAGAGGRQGGRVDGKTRFCGWTGQEGQDDAEKERGDFASGRDCCWEVERKEGCGDGWEAERQGYESEVRGLQGEVKRLQTERLSLLLAVDDAAAAGHGEGSGVAAAQRRAAVRNDLKRCYRWGRRRWCQHWSVLGLVSRRHVRGVGRM